MAIESGGCPGPCAGPGPVCGTPADVGFLAGRVERTLGEEGRERDGYRGGGREGGGGERK